MSNFGGGLVTAYKSSQLDMVVQFVKQNPGAKVGEIAPVLGLDNTPYFRTDILVRLVNEGRLRREVCGHRARPYWRYYAAEESV